MKALYTKPALEIELFETEDIIMTSDPLAGDEEDQGTAYPWSLRAPTNEQ